MSLSRGIDISHHQGSVNWALLKARHGLTWGACKATEGTSFKDDRFASNWAGLRAAGMTRLAYHFARPSTTSSGSEQAAFFASVVKPVPGDVLVLDLEASTLGQAGTNAWALTFGRYLRARYPLNTLVVYAGGYARNGSGKNLRAVFDYWWYPRYPGISSWPTSIPSVSDSQTGWSVPHIWQWTDRLSPGYDANVSSLTAAQLRTRPGTAPISKKDDPLAELSDESKQWFLDNIGPVPMWNRVIATPGGTKHSAGTWLVFTNLYASQLVAMVKDLASKDGLDPAQVERILTDALKGLTATNTFKLGE